jgi:hypothetical protein
VAEKQKPGVLLYFADLRPMLNRLSDDELGVLFRAVIDFSEFGLEPSELPGMSAFAFDILRPCLERDAQRYRKTVAQRKYAAFCRERMRQGVERNGLPTFSEWQDDLDTIHRLTSPDIEIYRPTSPDIETHPTPTPTPTPTEEERRSPQETRTAPMSECEFERVKKERMAMLAFGGHSNGQGTKWPITADKKGVI